MLRFLLLNSRWPAFALRAGLVAVVLAGLWVRVWLAIKSHGSDDIDLWQRFAGAIEQLGVLRCYELIPLFNHPPLAGQLAVLAAKVARGLDLPFDVTFKLLPIAADVVTGVVLYKIWRRRSAGHAVAAVGMFAFALCSILVTGYHGNTDSLVACFVLLSVYLLDGCAFFRSGLALGAAINVKLIPCLLIPALLPFGHGRRPLLRFVAGLAVGALPFVPVLTVWSSFFDNALAYNSEANLWGVQGILMLAGATRNLSAHTHDLSLMWWRFGRYLIVGAMVALAIVAVRTKRWTPFERAALGVTGFLVLTPGFGVQYTVYAVPLLLAISLARGLLYSSAAGAFLFSVYCASWTGAVPYASVFTAQFPPLAVMLGAVCWTLLVVEAWAILRRPR